MKTLITISTLSIVMMSCQNNSFTKIFEPQISICDLYEKQSIFADSLIELHQMTVTECTGVFSIYYASISDKKCSIKLFTTRPYKLNEMVDVTARYKVMFNYNGQACSALVTDDFPIKYLFTLLTI